MNFRNLVKKRAIVIFFILTYLITWGLGAPADLIPGWPKILGLFMVTGPAIGAVIVTAVVKGKVGVEHLLSSLTRWRVGLGWYGIVLLGPAITMVVSIGLYGLFVNDSVVLESVQLIPMMGTHLLTLIGIFVYQLLIVWGEEIGWRGYALPRLQNKIHPLLASLVLGVLWGFWHLPFFLIKDSVHQKMGLPFFILATIGYTVLYTWIYNGTKGSVFLICLLHAANNTTVSYTMLFFPPLIENPLFSLAVLAFFNGVVILFAGPKLLWQPMADVS
ncbi:MAG: hypothetical protein CL609_03885 [Anaerolineaceae bacterium]|nr:hypothetical protein [Anaerolineaceae bacterium]